MIEIIREVRTIIGFDGLDMRIGAHTVLFLFLFFLIRVVLLVEYWVQKLSDMTYMVLML